MKTQADQYLARRAVKRLADILLSSDTYHGMLSGPGLLSAKEVALNDRFIYNFGIASRDQAQACAGDYWFIFRDRNSNIAHMFLYRCSVYLKIGAQTPGLGRRFFNFKKI
jgi:hypothetical protein